MINYNFKSKNVLITGSSRGMGACILEAFAQAGAHVWLHYWNDPEGANFRDAEVLANRLHSAGCTVRVVSGDVRKPEDMQAIMTEIQQKDGGLDILVNNAGVLRDKTLKNLTLDDWQFVLDTNLNGVFHCCKTANTILRDHGRIVNIASIAGLFPFHGQSNYAAAKAGVIALTKVLAKELARRKITVNAVAPGVIQTSMIESIKPEVRAEYEKQIPMGRLGLPQDVANAVLFLASEETEYITGQVLPITGGWF
ncbi:SDR family oxidoreductase [Telmatocola sphagniphila]|uniref:SDR family oxidoreductase n=1 Tax=Telmatocola sphagniphila TaxID=1123043 RepID=A0A8E6B6K4_9BACT|nr:SDR family NAD(P)-dependent oxidoreductase [Telmatocola sphagniphila]QVL32818.1 SDR family oxidoreductase [Telmatocola sphagniphila]